MANCGKCHAELIGSAKFCATCGAPVPSAPAVSPAAASSGNAGVAAIDTGGYAPPSVVNPFAATASPSSPSLSKRGSAGSIAAAEPIKAVELPAEPPRPPSVPPPATTGSRPPMGDGSPSQVSPLAVSNAISNRKAFQEAVEEAARAKQASVAPEPSVAKAKKPGTQLMASAPVRPPPAKPAEPAEPAPKPAPKGKTVAMPFNAAAMMMAKGQAPGGAAPGSAVPSGPQQPPAPAPQSVGYAAPAHGMPQSVIQPSGIQPSGPQAPQSVLQPSTPQTPYAPAAPQSVGYPPATSQPQQPPSMYGQQPPSAYGQPAPQPPPPAGPGGWGWTPQQAAAQPQAPMGGGYGYGGGFGFPAGSRVHVTWSNGQRYPATVSQVSGTQCLVVFPDGQQHWVEMQFLSPG